MTNIFIILLRLCDTNDDVAHICIIHIHVPYRYHVCTCADYVPDPEYSTTLAHMCQFAFKILIRFHLFMYVFSHPICRIENNFTYTRLVMFVLQK